MHRTPNSNKKPENNRSPYSVCLCADNERIDEENTVRLQAKVRREKALVRRKEKARNESALQEVDELQSLQNLRLEKRKILDEEKRLKALLEIERANAHRKDSRQAAVLAEKRRHAAKIAKRHAENSERLSEREAGRLRMLLAKHNLTKK